MQSLGHGSIPSINARAYGIGMRRQKEEVSARITAHTETQCEIDICVRMVLDADTEADDPRAVWYERQGEGDMGKVNGCT